MGISCFMIGEKASSTNISILRENMGWSGFIQVSVYPKKQRWDPIKTFEMNVQLGFMLWSFISMTWLCCILYVKYRYRWQMLVVMCYLYCKQPGKSILVTL